MTTESYTQEMETVTRDSLQGWIPTLAEENELRSALEQAFDYRGDVTITLKNGEEVVGYVYDRKKGDSLQTSFARVLPQDGSARRNIAYADIAGLNFSGRDTAAGKSWEAWVKKFAEKKAAGEKNIGLHPDERE